MGNYWSCSKGHKLALVNDISPVIDIALQISHHLSVTDLNDAR
jgi:hypothetical protein